MNNLFSIGELAKYQHVSKQTLIFYDKIGLFRPAFVDPSTATTAPSRSTTWIPF